MDHTKLLEKLRAKADEAIAGFTGPVSEMMVEDAEFALEICLLVEFANSHPVSVVGGVEVIELSEDHKTATVRLHTPLREMFEQYRNWRVLNVVNGMAREVVVVHEETKQ